MKELAIIGFGNQAKAWALNLRDSDWKIMIGLRPNSSSMSKCEELGFEYFDYTQSNAFSFFAILTPDDTHLEIVKTIHQNKSTANFIYAHGFALSYTNLLEEFKNSNHVLIAPKAIASELRYQYEIKGKSGGVYSFQGLKDLGLKDFFLKLGKDLGLNSLHEATYQDETKADLFSEQTLLCSTLPYAALYSYKQLRQRGISKEVAYFECWHEVKLIADTLMKVGPEKFFDLISPNALIGSQIGHSVLFNNEYLKKIDEIYNHIESGEFSAQIEKTNIKQVRKDILTFWQEQELTHVHNRLKDELY